jgi:hypothetical protein
VCSHKEHWLTIKRKKYLSLFDILKVLEEEGLQNSIIGERCSVIIAFAMKHTKVCELFIASNFDLFAE